jgi:hypothetical protein
MWTKWTDHLNDPVEKENFQNSIRGAKRVLDRIKAICDEEENTLDRTEMDAKSFDNPNWAYKQAFKNGYRKGLQVTKTLVDLDHQVIKGETNGRDLTVKQ